MFKLCRLSNESPRTLHYFPKVQLDGVFHSTLSTWKIPKSFQIVLSIQVVSLCVCVCFFFCVHRDQPGSDQTSTDLLKCRSRKFCWSREAQYLYLRRLSSRSYSAIMMVRCVHDAYCCWCRCWSCYGDLRNVVWCRLGLSGLFTLLTAWLCVLGFALNTFALPPLHFWWLIYSYCNFERAEVISFESSHV